MNLLDLQRKEWAPAVLAAVPGGATLAAKLGSPAPSHATYGTIAPYFAAEYGFARDAALVAWSGDNPCSVAGLGLRAPGDVAVSLGTSDTMFGILSAPTPGPEGHLFANPVDPSSYMAMLCYKNGSLTREAVRNAAAGGSWDAFNALLAGSQPGNGGSLGFYFDAPEITPTVATPGVRRFAPGAGGRGAHTRVASFPPAVEARAVVEGQFMSMRLHGESIGMTAPRRLIATGGASGNAAVLQVLADVFGAPVYVASQTDSASLGAAYRAAHGWVVAARGAFVPFETVLQQGAAAAAPGGGAAAGGAGPIALTLAASPRPAATAAYTALLPAYAACEAQVVAEK
jgi:xylulokinase